MNDSDISKFLELHESNIQKLKDMINVYEKVFLIDDLERYPQMNQIERSVFIKNIYPEIDELDSIINQNKEYLECIAKELSKYVDKKAESPIKVEYNEINDWHLILTKNRGKTLKSRLKNLSIV